MYTNVILGFVLPWIIGGYFLRRDLSVIIHVGPVSNMIAFAFNEIGFHMGWWR